MRQASGLGWTKKSNEASLNCASKLSGGDPTRQKGEGRVLHVRRKIMRTRPRWYRTEPTGPCLCHTGGREGQKYSEGAGENTRMHAGDRLRKALNPVTLSCVEGAPQ